MKLKDTLFILGAGSSYTYGFPLGTTLLDKIKAFSNESSYEFVQEKFKEHLIFERNFNKTSIDSFCNSLKLSGTSSIDTYIQKYSEVNHLYLEIGRIIISYFISQCSLEHLSAKTNEEDPWIEYFIRRCISYDREAFIDSPPSILSFNYDSLFEYKIEKNFSEETYNTIKSPLNIDHIYGQIDKELCLKSLNGLTTNNVQHTNDFKSKCNKIIDNSVNIKLIRQNALKDYSEYLNQFETIILLGYGFHPLNNEKLFRNRSTLTKLIESKKIYSSGIGIDSSIVNEFNSLVQGKKIILENKNCTETLKHVLPLPIFPNEE